MKLTLNMILIFILVFVFAVCASNYVFAATGASTQDAITAMNGLNDAGADDTTSKTLGPILNTALGFVQIVGTGISVIMVTMLGIKYMLAAPADKADVKKQIAPLVIGAILLFAAANIINVVAQIATTLPAS